MGAVLPYSHCFASHTVCDTLWVLISCSQGDLVGSIPAGGAQSLSSDGQKVRLPLFSTRIVFGKIGGLLTEQYTSGGCYVEIVYGPDQAAQGREGLAGAEIQIWRRY